MAFFKL